MNEFIHVYRYVSADSRPRLFDDCREPITIDFTTLEYGGNELDRPLDERLGTTREVRFQQHTDKVIYDRQPFTNVAASVITERISAFLKESDHVAPGQEFLSIARHAAFQIKNLKHAVLEAFISAETMVVGFLRERKIAKGVSRSKLKDWEDEIGIGYMLNVELPMLVDDMTKGDRQTLGEVDKVRKMRNDIVHDGKRPTEEEAQFAVKAIEKLHDALRRWTP